MKKKKQEKKERKKENRDAPNPDVLAGNFTVQTDSRISISESSEVVWVLGVHGKARRLEEQPPT